MRDETVSASAGVAGHFDMRSGSDSCSGSGTGRAYYGAGRV